MIFIFRQYDSQKQIIIYAESYLEAKEALFEFNPWADKTYNILEYKMYQIDYIKFFDILGIEYDMRGYPRIISKKEFEELRDNKVILDEQFKNIHNTKVLTKQFAGENTNLLSTEEFVGQLKNYAESIGKTKKSIYQMLNIIGDIWYEEFYVNGLGYGNKYIVYGKSRYQCKKTLEKLKEGLKGHKITSYDKQELLIDYDYGNELTQTSIEKYNKMINFIKTYNIKKFPFITYKEEEQ